MSYFTLTNKSRIGKPINKDYKRVRNNSWHDNSHDNNSSLFMVTECSNLNNFDDVLYRGKSIKQLLKVLFDGHVKIYPWSDQVDALQHQVDC